MGNARSDWKLVTFDLDVYVTFKFQGHWINLKVTVAKQGSAQVYDLFGHSLIPIFLDTLEQSRI